MTRLSNSDRQNSKIIAVHKKPSKRTTWMVQHSEQRTRWVGFLVVESKFRKRPNDRGESKSTIDLSVFGCVFLACSARKTTTSDCSPIQVKDRQGSPRYAQYSRECRIFGTVDFGDQYDNFHNGADFVGIQYERRVSCYQILFPEGRVRFISFLVQQHTERTFQKISSLGADEVDRNVFSKVSRSSIFHETACRVDTYST